MGNPLTTNKTGGICFAFPDVCLTQAGPTQVAIPYPNIGELKDADPVSDNVFAEKNNVVHGDSKIKNTTGDEAGIPTATRGKVEFPKPSQTVLVNGHGAVRMFDMTTQNNGNAVGTVLAGVPTVLVGG